MTVWTYLRYISRKGELFLITLFLLFDRDGVKVCYARPDLGQTNTGFPTKMMFPYLLEKYLYPPARLCDIYMYLIRLRSGKEHVSSKKLPLFVLLMMFPHIVTRQGFFLCIRVCWSGASTTYTYFSWQRNYRTKN